MDTETLPLASSGHYNVTTLKYKLLSCIYDIIAISLCTLDRVTNILVIVEFYHLQHSRHVHCDIDQFFFITLLCWLCLIQLVYIIFIVTSCNDCNSGGCVLISIIITPFVPIIHYFVNLCNIRIGHREPRFKYNSDDPLLTQFCTVLKNKHAAFLLQTFGESIPSVVIQIIAIIYHSNTDTLEHNQLILWLSISIGITFVTMIIHVLILIDWSYITNKWFIFNYLCIICDILSFFTAVSWVFYHNDNFLDDNNLIDILLNGDLSGYQAVWIYSAIISIFPTLCTIMVAVIVGIVTCIVWYCRHNQSAGKFYDSLEILIFAPILPLGGILATLGLFFLLIIAIFAQMFCWSGIALLIFDLNKFAFKTKYDSILWNHFLIESKLMKKHKKLAVIAINYSLLRKSKILDNDDYMLSNLRWGYQPLRNCLETIAKSEAKNIKNQEKKKRYIREPLKHKLNRKIVALTNSNNDSTEYISVHSTVGYSSTVSNSIHSNPSNVHDDQIENINRSRLKDLSFSKMRSINLNQDWLYICRNRRNISQELKFGLLFGLLAPMHNVNGAVVRIVALIFGIWVELTGVIPFLLSRLIVIALPWIILLEDIVAKIVSNSYSNGIEGMKWYYEKEVINNNENVIKHLLLIINLICYLAMIFLLIFDVLPMFYYCYHILPRLRRIPNINSRNLFEYLFMDIYACYDVLFLSQVRQFYVLKRFGDDIGTIVLNYLGINKNNRCDIETLIDALNPKINCQKKATGLHIFS